MTRVTYPCVYANSGVFIEKVLIPVWYVLRINKAFCVGVHVHTFVCGSLHCLYMCEFDGQHSFMVTT